VDGFLVAAVPHFALIPMPNAAIVGEAPEARIELQLVTSTGTPLFRGTDQRRGGTIHTGTGVIDKLMRAILKEALPTSSR
jgi:hypothetical protein